MLRVPSPVSTQPPLYDTAAVLHRQLRMNPRALSPGTLPLQRDVRWIADHIVEKLEPLGGDQRHRLAIEALHQRLCNSEQQLELSANELPGYYAFFKEAEHLLKQHRTRRHPDIEADYTLCRALKWQFRAAISDGQHQRLTQRLLTSLAYVRKGGERSNHRHIGLDYPLESTRQLSAGPHLAIDSHLHTGPDQRVHSTRVIALQGKLKSTLTELSEGRSEQHLSLGHVMSRTYASLEHYADSRSASLRTSLSESIGRTLGQMRELVSDHRHLHRHRAYSALSQPYVRQALARAGLAAVELPVLHPPSAPIIREKGIALTVHSKVAMDFFSVLNVNSTLTLTLQRTRLSKVLDILGLHDMAPTLALQHMAGSKRQNDDAVTLLTAMNTHVADSSRRFTLRASARLPASALNRGLSADHRHACALLERYVRLKANSRIDPEQDNAIRALIDQHRVLLRPDSLKVYRLTAPSRTLSGSSGITASSQPGSGRGVTIEISHRKRDDPHLSGDYLTIDIAPLKPADALKKSLRQALSAIGEQTFEWDHLIRSISESLLNPAKPSHTQVLVKIKHGEPVVLLTRHTLSKARDLTLPHPVERHSGLDLQSLRTRKTLRQEHVGDQSLDHLLPIARHCLQSSKQSHAWDAYLQQHADDVQALLDRIGEQHPGTVLSSELDALKRITPALASAVDTLTRQARTAAAAPTSENRSQALAAFNAVLVAYLPHYEAKVSEAWTLC
ncbi:MULTISPECIES: hypothetical protein [Pseudomonas]|uniref:hypothetical protein n=1 Tax=Pseudomonas TaxID=286 RepID=UPI0008126E17|nr:MULTISPECIES: hypothetical protein [Pseudomonas]RZI22842.1 hypothetical protein EUX53_13695 [Pseudomonas orientalis]CRM25350.1 hypothetical protein [Pseudomonas sp. 28 E 9]